MFKKIILHYLQKFNYFFKEKKDNFYLLKGKKSVITQ